jgi:ABC-type Fe3+-hydroxamate transport system substrate-binding protein
LVIPPTEVVDAVGQQHVIAGADARIVSLVPSLTELVVELGLAEQLVGRTGFCIHPREVVKAIPKVGGTKDVKFDRIREIGATHVLVNVDENRREDADTLAKMGVAVVATHPQTPADNRGLYALLGTLFSREQEACELTAAFDAAMAAPEFATSVSLGVLYLIWRDPWMTISTDTYIANMLELGGMQVVATESPDRYPQVDPKEPAWQNADAILLSSEPYPFREKHLAEVRDLACEAGKIVRLVDGELLSWYGSRAVSGVSYARQLGHEVRSQTPKLT